MEHSGIPWERPGFSAVWGSLRQLAWDVTEHTGPGIQESAELPVPVLWASRAGWKGKG